MMIRLLLTITLLFAALTLSPAQAANDVVYLRASDQPTQEGATVTVEQVEQPATTVCTYHLTNILPGDQLRAINGFSLGEHNTRPPVLPLGWDRDDKDGWTKESSSSIYKPGHIVGLGAKTVDDLIFPGHSRDFTMIFPKPQNSETDSIRCDAYDWTVVYVAAHPRLAPKPTTLSLSISNVHMSQPNILEPISLLLIQAQMTRNFT
jgi:hypothetical protein